MKDTKEQLIRKKKNLKEKTKIREKGITLIALVVTIIILLILTGVTLNIALSDGGLFEKAKDAVEKYKKAGEDEEDALSKLEQQLENINIDYSKYVGATVTGYNPKTKTSEDPCTIEGAITGHDSAQNFTTDGKMSWKVWDFDGNTLRIIGDPTTEKLTLKGAAGYNNGVWAINKICNECYSNKKEGVTVTSLKRSDIQKVSNYDYTQYKHEDGKWEEVTDDSSETIGNLIYFGETKTYNTVNTKYPKMWGDFDQKWKYEYNSESSKNIDSDKEGTTWEIIGTDDGKMGSTMIDNDGTKIFKQSYYYHNYNKSEFSNEKYYDLIFKKTNETSETENFWLAGRYVQIYEDRL